MCKDAGSCKLVLFLFSGVSIRLFNGMFDCPGGVSGSSSDIRRFMEGVDESARPSHRLDRFDCGVIAVAGVAFVEEGLGR
jgi:hypothetical protein